MHRYMLWTDKKSNAVGKEVKLEPECVRTNNFARPISCEEHPHSVVHSDGREYMSLKIDHVGCVFWGIEHIFYNVKQEWPFIDRTYHNFNNNIMCRNFIKVKL